MTGYSHALLDQHAAMLAASGIPPAPGVVVVYGLCRGCHRREVAA